MQTVWSQPSGQTCAISALGAKPPFRKAPYRLSFSSEHGRLMPRSRELNRTNVIAHLCLTAGALMEDTSVELARVLPAQDERQAHLHRLRQTADDIAALIAAAEVLNRRGNSH